MNYKNIIDSPQGGFIFIGKKYSGLMKEAVYLAETIANKGVNGISFDVHPDIHIISIIDGKKKILLSQIEEIGEYENKYPIYAESVMLDIMYNYTGCGLRVISKDMALRLLTFYSLDKVVKILQNINLAIEKIEKGVFTNNDLFLLVNNFAY